MRLDHLLTADGLGTPMSEPQRLHLRATLTRFGFVATPDGYELDETFAWVSVVEVDGGYHVTVGRSLPAHVFDAAIEALETVVRDAGLVRIDLLSRGRIDAVDWARRVAEASGAVLRGRFP